MMQNITQKFRKLAGLTLREFAEQVGASFQAVAAWEQGLYRPRQDRLLRIWSDCADWRHNWAAECLAAYYPEAWKILTGEANHVAR